MGNATRAPYAASPPHSTVDSPLHLHWWYCLIFVSSICQCCQTAKYILKIDMSNQHSAQFAAPSAHHARCQERLPPALRRHGQGGHPGPQGPLGLEQPGHLQGAAGAELRGGAARARLKCARPRGGAAAVPGRACGTIARSGSDLRENGLGCLEQRAWCDGELRERRSGNTQTRPLHAHSGALLWKHLQTPEGRRSRSPPPKVQSFAPNGVVFARRICPWPHRRRVARARRTCRKPRMGWQCRTPGILRGGCGAISRAR